MDDFEYWRSIVPTLSGRIAPIQRTESADIIGSKSSVRCGTIDFHGHGNPRLTGSCGWNRRESAQQQSVSRNRAGERDRS